MRKSASEIIRSLETRIANLENQTNSKTAGDIIVHVMDPSHFNIDMHKGGVEQYRLRATAQEIPDLIRKSNVTIEEYGLQIVDRDNMVYSIHASKDDLLKALLPLAKPSSIKVRKGGRSASKSLDRKTAQSKSHEGKLVYLDPRQAQYFGVDYYKEGDSISVSADALLRSADYDRKHREILTDLKRQNATLYLVNTGSGWFKIQGILY